MVSIWEPISILSLGCGVVFVECHVADGGLGAAGTTVLALCLPRGSRDCSWSIVDG